MSIFDEALKKRFNEAPLITSIEVTSNDTLLIRDLETGVIMRMPVSVLTSALQAYSESTYSPTWNGGTLTVNRAVVTKIGRTVIAQIDVLLGSSSASEECKITLPETPSAGFHTGIINYSSYSATMVPNIDSGFGANVVFRSDQSSGNLTCAQLSGSRLAFTAIYTK